jgi:Carboxypeptidase regulatory-like domain
MARAALCLVTFMIAAQPAVSQTQTPPRDTPNTATGTAVIRGRVLDAASGRPLSHAEVTLSGQAVLGGPRRVWTEGDGRYEFTGIPAGELLIGAQKPNFLRAMFGASRPEGPGKRVTLANSQVLAIDFRLTRAGAITGKIVDEFGDPVTGAGVVAMRYQYIQGSRRLTPAGRGGSTNDVGEFRLYGLSPGQYFLSATIRGTGMGAADESPDRAGYAPTYYPGTPIFTEAQRVAVAEGQTIASVNFSLLPTRTAKITGSVVDADGKPATGMVVLMQRAGAVMMNSFNAPLSIDGKFSLNGVTPGDYTLVSRGGAAQETLSTDLAVSGSDITNLQLTMAKPSTIRGRIVFTDSATQAAAPKPSAVDLGAWREWALGQPVRSPAKISDDGTFDIALGAGHVVLRAAPTGGSPGPTGTPAWRLNRVVAQDVDVADTGIDVPPNGTIENIVVEMTNHLAELSGRVADADGAIVRDCFVVVFAQDTVHWTVQTRHLGVARPAAQDVYMMRLLPGDYYAAAFGDVDNGAWTDPEFLALAREHATKFSIADGEKKTMDLRLSPTPVY